MKNIIKKRQGLSLLEIILTIAIIGIISVTFMPLFVMSSNINNKAEVALDSIYIGKDIMEKINYLSETIPYNELEDTLIYEEGYTRISDNIYTYEYEDKKYAHVIFSESNNLINVIVRIYKDKNMDKLEVQYQSMYFWKEWGLLSE